VAEILLTVTLPCSLFQRSVTKREIGLLLSSYLLSTNPSYPHSTVHNACIDGVHILSVACTVCVDELLQLLAAVQWRMSSSILDLSLSRGAGTAADISSSSSSRRLSSPPQFTASLEQHSGGAESCPEDLDNDAAARAATSSRDVHAAAPHTDDKRVSSHATSGSGSSSEVSDDAASSRDIADQRLRHRSRDQSYQYLDYQAAAAAAAAASRFLLPFPFPSPTAATGSAPMTSSVVPPFYPLSFPALPPPPEAAIHLRPEGAASATAVGTSCHVSRSSSAKLKVRVLKEDDEGVTGSAVGHVVDPSYAERRRKNNEAARRSRDARRMKERETCLRAALLQQENLRLRAEMTVLKTEITRLHCLLYDKM